MFERFTDRARRVIVLSQDEARQLSHDYIGTEHLLLGMLREGEGVAAVALEGSGITLDAARADVEARVGRGTRTPSGHIPITPRAKQVLEMSLREALDRGHDYLGTEHILLGLLREGHSVGCDVVDALGDGRDQLRTRVLGLLAGTGAASPPRVPVPTPKGSDGPTTEAAAAGSELPVFRRFTSDARSALVLAGAEAPRSGLGRVGEEDLLIGILAEGKGRGARALAAVGVTLEAAHRVIPDARGPREREAGERLPLHASAVEVVEMALVEAVTAGRDRVDSGDLLLGLVRRAEAGTGSAGEALTALGTSPAALRSAMTVLDPGESA